MSILKEEWNIEGQILLELLVALGILALTIGASFSLFFGNQSLTVDSTNAGLALDYASEGLEAVRAIRDRDFSGLTDGLHGLAFQDGAWVFVSESDSRDNLTRTVSISTVDVNTKEASTTVSWTTGGRALSVELVSQFTQWMNPLSGGCSSETITGNWAAPQLIGSADLGPGNAGTDVALRLPYLFVSGVASASGKPDLFVFDASNEALPTLVASVNIGAHGINALFLRGDYLYAASSNNSKELMVFDVQNPAAIAEIAAFDLSGDHDAISISGFGNAIYIGRKESDAAELTVIDVTSPAAPAIAVSFEIDGDVNDLFGTSQRLYAVTDDAAKDIALYDIQNPLSPQLLADYVLEQGDELQSVIYDTRGNLLVGDQSNQLFILGATTTASIYPRSSLNIGGGVGDIACVGDTYAFLSTTNSGKEFIVITMANPDAPSEVASLNLPQIAAGIEFSDNKVFMVVRSNDAVKIITSSP